MLSSEMHFLATNPHSVTNERCVLHHHPAGFSPHKRTVYVMCLPSPIGAIPAFSSSQRWFLRCTWIATEAALLLCTSMDNSAGKLLLSMLQRQAGDKAWEAMKSSNCLENSAITSGNSSLVAVGLTTHWKATTISICMKCSTQPFTRCL